MLKCDPLLGNPCLVKYIGYISVYKQSNKGEHKNYL